MLCSRPRMFTSIRRPDRTRAQNHLVLRPDQFEGWLPYSRYATPVQREPLNTNCVTRALVITVRFGRPRHGPGITHPRPIDACPSAVLSS